MSDVEGGAREWAWTEFGTAQIGDARRKLRLLKMGARLAAAPAGKISEVFATDAERQGAYGLLENKEVEAAAIHAAMQQGCARRSATEEVVLVPVDGSSLHLTERTQDKGFGSVGAFARHGRGLKVITALAVSAVGTPIGVAAQTWWSRPGTRASKHHNCRGIEEKETRHWLDTIAQTRRVFGALASHTKCWFQLDREADAWPILLQAGEAGHYTTVRAHQNRRVIDRDGQKTFLHRFVKRAPQMGVFHLTVTPGPQRSERVARMVVRASTVTLDLRDQKTQRRVQTTLNVVLAREQGTAPSGENRLEWLLLTNRKVDNFAQACQVIFAYSQRWRIEDFHRTWKSGACHVEQTQLRTKEAVIKWATLLAAVAARIERIKHLSRSTPDVPAAVEFSAQEIRAVLLLRHGKKARDVLRSAPTPTLAQVTRWIADLGGYTGKSSGGPPGSITLARGLKHLQAAVCTLDALEDDK
jgi:Transposase DNA-binding/Transposase Tn5 dimerisation domain